MQEWQFARSNVISRTARVSGAENVAIAGNSIVRNGVRIRGDLACVCIHVFSRRSCFRRVRIGRYCDIGQGAALRPPYRINGDGVSLSFLPVAVASHVIIGSGALIEAVRPACSSLQFCHIQAWIGVGVRVGAYAIVGKSCVLKDYCIVAAGAIVPDDAVLAPMSIVRRTRTPPVTNCPGRRRTGACCWLPVSGSSCDET